MPHYRRLRERRAGARAVALSPRVVGIMVIIDPLMSKEPRMSVQIKSLVLAVVSGCLALTALNSPAVESASLNAANPLTQDWHWRLVGPFRGGRTRAIAGVPHEPDTYYVGVVNGGVLKTDDAGRTWTPIFDDQPTQSIGAIAVAPSQPQRVYVASGEGLQRPDLSVGSGVFVSDDGGRHFEQRGLVDSQQIPELAVDPTNPDVVLAAVLGHPFGPNTERGVFRSTDAGRHWTRVLYVDEHTGANGVLLDPSNPKVVYATLWEGRLGPWEDNNQYNGTHGGIYKSTDGGLTFKKLTNGLPDNASQINITIAASQPNRLMAMVATSAPSEYSSANGLELYRSDDGGEHWHTITTDPRPKLRIGGGDNAVVKIDPNHPDVVYSASIVTMKSTDGGVHWQPLRGAPGGDDYQNIYINPEDSNRIVLVGDQGALVSVNGGKTFSSWLNQPTAQLYHVGITAGFPYRICSGQQESGSVCIASRGNDGEITDRDWHPVGVIEYGYVAPDPLNPDVVYGAGRTEVTRTHLSTGRVDNITPVTGKDLGVRTDRTEPLMFSPNDPHALYFGASRLFKTTDGGDHWQIISPDLARAEPGVPDSVGERRPKDAEKQRGVIYALGISAVQKGLLVAGTDDGQVYKSNDDGGHWENITPPALTAWSKVTQIETSHFDPKVIYLSVSRLRIDDLKPYVYKTQDGGAHWQLVVEGLSAPVNAVREDPQQAGLLYAATEHDVMMSLDDGAHWESLSLNLPHTSMRDVVVKDNDLVLATHGRSFWVLDDVSRLRQAARLANDQLVHPATAIRVARSTWSDTPIARDEPLGENPPAGAVIDYRLHAKAKEVTIEIKNAQGERVRVFTSHDAPNPSEEELEHQLIPRWWALQRLPLSTEVGMHRLVWDLAYPEPASLTRGYPISAVLGKTPREPEGPLVLPGTYTVVLTVDGRREQSTLEVVKDPRLADASGLSAQWPVLMTVYQWVNDTAQAALLVKSVDQQLEALEKAITPQQKELHEAIERLDQTLKPFGEDKASATALEPLSAKASGLYTLVGRGDAKPTEAALNAVNGLRPKVESALTQWQRVQPQVLKQVQALNRQLKRAKLPTIDVDRAPVRDVNAADED
jgi:photosystem II stability/assembly factor-like uncharacterized protein